jgi:hypothetical protein
MKPNPGDEIADRIAEERSEDDGMPEHAAKADDPVRWGADRGTRVSKRKPERSPSRPGMFGIALMSCAMLAALAAMTAPSFPSRWTRYGAPI